jgi:putative transposase
MRDNFRKKMVSAQACCEQARYPISHGPGQRRACALIHVSRANLGYISIMPSKRGPIVETMRRFSSDYPLFGSRRIRVMLGREGIVIGKERCSRLWAQTSHQVPCKRRLRRLAGSDLRPLAPSARNAVWSYDFVFDACANGQQLKCLTVGYE